MVLSTKNMQNILPSHYRTKGFTIIELIIVIVVIAILAVIITVSYNGIQARAKETVIKNDLQGASTQLQSLRSTSGAYATNVSDLKKSPGVVFQYSYEDDTFCITATRPDYAGKAFFISSDSPMQEGICSGHSLTPSGDVTIEPGISDGALMQTITDANCPTTLTMAVDARDNRTYWVKKLSYGKCWMLTNLAYVGGTSNGGVDTYGDTKTLTLGSTTNSYTVPYYFIPSGANPTTNPTAPSTSTTGTGQLGYLYNWCAAMGAQNGTNGQPNTSACSSASSPLPNMSISICPAGWRLPTISPTNEFAALNTAINGGVSNTIAGFKTNWFAQQSGYARSGLFGNGVNMGYWSSSQQSAVNGYYIDYNGSLLNTAQSNTKYIGFGVRCIAT